MNFDSDDRLHRWLVRTLHSRATRRAHALLNRPCALGADETACLRADARRRGCAELRGHEMLDAALP